MVKVRKKKRLGVIKASLKRVVKASITPAIIRIYKENRSFFSFLLGISFTVNPPYLFFPLLLQDCHSFWEDLPAETAE
jgi:hypothetical protein